LGCGSAALRCIEGYSKHALSNARVVALDLHCIPHAEAVGRFEDSLPKYLPLSGYNA
jgi:hypothetical protein